MSCGKHIPAAHNDHTRASSVYSSLYSPQVKENHANQPRTSLMLEDEEEACPLPLEQVPTRPRQLPSPRQALCIFSSVGLSWEALLDRPSLNSTSWRPRPVGIAIWSSWGSSLEAEKADGWGYAGLQHRSGTGGPLTHPVPTATRSSCKENPYIDLGTMTLSRVVWPVHCERIPTLRGS